MTVINYQDREITCKIVYFGPARSGKTTNLQWIHEQVPSDRRGDIVSIATQSDRTLFFDFLPLDLGVISGFTTRLNLYTVPGQPQYESTRRIVLKGADGVVFVADSRAEMLDENAGALADLHVYLHSHGVDPRTVPLVMQYNKQDLPSQLRTSSDELDKVLNYRRVPRIAAAALRGAGVFHALNAVTTAVLHQLAERSRPAEQVA
ncbi:MAG: ADP-ribosylation factor-like protein [Gemmatimonadota bacterium]|nr:ADP-ribosylation factor-like protein [Gemmatimonadota bacterium]